MASLRSQGQEVAGREAKNSRSDSLIFWPTEAQSVCVCTHVRGGVD